MSLPSTIDRPFGCPLDEADETLVLAVMVFWVGGWNTADMARKLGLQEAEVYRALRIGLDRRKAKAG